MNRMTALLAALAMLTGMTASPEFAGIINNDVIFAENAADSSVYEYDCGKYILGYTVKGDEAAICYCNAEDSDIPVYLRDSIDNLEVPEKIGKYTVTEIGDDVFAFILYSKLSLPDTVRKIGDNALGNYNESSDTFTFPRDTEEIGKNVFSSLNASKIVIPEKVSYISESAFRENYTFEVDSNNKYYEVYNNALVSKDHTKFIKYFGKEQLKSYSIPAGTKVICPYAFKYSEILNLSIPDSVESIGEGAFYFSAFQSISIPDSIKEIKANTFQLSSIKRISLPDSVESIGKNAFEGSRLETVKIPKNVKSIQEGAFSDCEYLEEVIFNEGLEYIQENAFHFCERLRTVNLPDTLTTIGEHAFADSEICGTFTIPSGVSKIERSAFLGTKISEFEVSKDNQYFSSEDGILFDKEKKTVIFCPPEYVKSEIVIPDSVTNIGENAFYSLKNLKKITFPDSVQKIGIYAFYYCQSLESVEFPSDLLSIDDAAFAQCTGLRQVKLPDGLKKIGNRAFESALIEAVTIPKSVEEVNNYAFSCCSNLKTVTVHPSLTNFNLKNVYSDFEIVYMGDDSFYIQDNVTYSSDKSVLISYPSYLQNKDTVFTVPDFVKKIDSYAFSGSNIRKIVLSENISSIGEYAFRNCENLEEFDYNGSTPDLGKGVFYGCSGLFDFELPENTAVIPEDTFEECQSIKTGRIPDGIKKLEKYSMPCTMDQVYIPSSVTKIDEDAFNTDHLKVICAKTGSYAEKFADEHNIKFVADGEDLDGDVNNDDKTNILDLIYLKSYLLTQGSSSKLKTDVNKDGRTSITDLMKLVDVLHGRNDHTGYKDIKLSRDNIDPDIVTEGQKAPGSFITNKKELNSVFEGYFKDSKLKDEYVDRYSDCLDNYVIYTHLYRNIWEYSYPVMSAQVYSIDDEQMTYSITDYPHGVYSDRAYLYTVLLPKSLYKGQKVKYTYDQKVVFADKPVIYLYPEEETEINVKVELDDTARFTCTYPEYPDETGWTVTAEPDSTLYDDKGNEYPYLFWEASTSREWDMSEGFVVKGEDTKEFLREKLSYLGLEPKEYTEFISFWLPKMENNKYNLISFQTDDYEEMAKLTVTPEPESVLRVFMTYKPLDEWEDVPEQKLTGFRRNGYTLIEWGGSEVK